MMGLVGLNPKHQGGWVGRVRGGQRWQVLGGRGGGGHGGSPSAQKLPPEHPCAATPIPLTPSTCTPPPSPPPQKKALTIHDLPK